MSEWKEVAISDVADLTVGFVGSMVNEYRDSGVKFIRSMNVHPFRIDFSDVKYISEEFNRKISKSQLRPNDVVIVRTGQPGASAVVPEGVGSLNCSDLVIIHPDQSKIDPLFLSAYINLSSGVVASNLVGAVQQHFNVGAAKKMMIKIPNIDTQRKISGLIGRINDKIETNKRINDNLNNQVHILCDAWLDKYIPFGSVCPNNWKLTSLSEIALFSSGYSYKGNEIRDSSIAMATIKNFDRNGGFKLDGYKEIMPSDKLKVEHYVELYDTLVAHTDLTQNADVIGNAEPVLSFSGYEKIIFSMDVVKVVPRLNFMPKLLLAAILQSQKFKAHCLGYVNGTTVLHLSKKALPEYSLMLPEESCVLRPLSDSVSALYKRMASNIEESAKLIRLRDTLLPRLMSGEIDVSQIAI